MRRGVILLVALIGLAALVGGFFWIRATFFEKVTETVSRGYIGEAAYNPFFALRQLINKLGPEARAVSGLSRLPGDGHTLLLALDDRPLVEREVRSLLDWVERGGHLVVSASTESVAAPFLAAAELGVHESEIATEDDGSREDTSSAFVTERLSWPRLYYFGSSPPLRSDGPSHAAWALTVGKGSGAITAVTDLRIFTNENLANAEHAELAWWLLGNGDGESDASPARGALTRGALARGALAEPPDGVWIVFRQAPVSVWVLLAQRARPVVLALALLSVAALALLARPFGPKLEPPPRDRRHLDEHLKATGRFLWDRDVEHTLLEAVQKGLTRRLARGGQPDESQMTELIRQAADPVDERATQAAIRLTSTRDPQKFTRAIYILEKLRRKV